MKRFLYLVVVATVLPSLSSHAGTDAFPPLELIGTWTGCVEVFGPFKAEPYPSQHPDDIQKVVITFTADGSVEGKVGEAVFQNSSVRRNRGWIERKLNLKTDFIVSGGTLQGRVTPRDEGTNSGFTIPFNIVDGKLKGTIMLIGKFPLTGPLVLTRQQENP
jgi:hypothetical protein